MINEKYFNKTIKEIMHNCPKFDFKLIDDWMWVQIDEDTLVRLPLESYDLPEGHFEIKGSATKFLELAMGTERFRQFGRDLRKMAIEKGLIPDDNKEQMEEKDKVL